jgi:uncharacterized protein YqhQ
MGEQDGEEVKFIMNPGDSLMYLCGESDELEIFNSKNFQDLILFKWTTFARQLHLFGWSMHCFYVLFMSIYVYTVYINNDVSWAKYLERLLIIVVIYPITYDSIQLYRTGFKEYLSQPQNYSDLIYNYGSLFNVIL